MENKNFMATPQNGGNRKFNNKVWIKKNYEENSRKKQLNGIAKIKLKKRDGRENVLRKNACKFFFIPLGSKGEKSCSEGAEQMLTRP